MVKPKLTIVVDSSDLNMIAEFESGATNIHRILTAQKSAAIQRNIGLDFLLSSSGQNEIRYVSFLDDDTLIPSDYFQSILDCFDHYKDCVGISGIAKTSGEVEENLQRSRLTDWIGITGNPGELTSSAVNISPIGINETSEVGWLIGCSTWRIEVFNELRFEKDFLGQSIFEDVIFSARARKFGKLICDPSILLFHNEAIEGRPSRKSHYADWLSNRFRIFSYDIPNLSRKKFWLLNFLLFTNSFLCSFHNLKKREKMKGLALGWMKLIKSELKK